MHQNPPKRNTYHETAHLTPLPIRPSQARKIPVFLLLLTLPRLLTLLSPLLFILWKLSNEDAVRSGKGLEIEAHFDLDVDLKYGELAEREGGEGMQAMVGEGMEIVPRVKGPEIIGRDGGVAFWTGLRLRLISRFMPFAFSFCTVGVLHLTAPISISISISISTSTSTSTSKPIPMSIESELTASKYKESTSQYPALA
jgi:hypothetical protein